MIRGVAGSGKTHLALSVIRRALQAGLSAGLLADDQTQLLTDPDGSLRANCPQAIAGCVEVRPFGIVDCEAITVDEARIHLLCDLVGVETSVDRVQQGNSIELFGVHLPHLALPAHQSGPNGSAVFAALGLPCWY